MELRDFVSRWGEPIDPVAVPEDYLAEYGERLPGLALALWRELGFAGFGAGLLWSCDPHRWQPIVDAWLAGAALPAGYAGEAIPLLRTAYGKIYCFLPGLGQRLIINPVLSKVTVRRPNPIAGPAGIDREMDSVLRHPRGTYLLDADPPEYGDDPQEDLFERITAGSGHLTASTVYSFAPRVQEGGTIRAEYATVVDAAAELHALRALGPPRVAHL
ncbi:GAD-like domain-containing protein [Nocardia sp. NPDC050697]|uniref:GAD-like domain-containing protein n=1 Tax=Nocardia sp. NPDC050697 TaxID=3155158 RepID=UPI003411583A